jgi:hypothetical protein
MHKNIADMFCSLKFHKCPIVLGKIVNGLSSYKNIS